MNNYIDKLAFIQIKDRKVLETLSRGKDKWYTPGGKREGEEVTYKKPDPQIFEISAESIISLLGA